MTLMAKSGTGLAYVAIALASLSGCADRAQDSPHIVADTSVEAGHYAIMFAGCNDCHTPGWQASRGATPESKWMTGTEVGVRGPWGMVYPTNVRLFVNSTSKESWIALFQAGPAVPVMPFWNYSHGRIDARDLASMYDYLKSLHN